MSERDRGKRKVSKSRPKKQQPVRLIQYSTTHPPLTSASSPSSVTTPSLTLPAFTYSIPSTLSPPLTQPSHRVVPPTEESLHNVGSFIPPTNVGSALGSNYTHDASDAQLSSNKPILYLEGNGFLPSHLAANGISDIFRSHYLKSWTLWKRIISTTRDMWFGEFMRKYIVIPSYSYWARRNFEKRDATLLKNVLEKTRKKIEKPSWLGDEIWDALYTHWESKAFKKKSAIVKANRASDCGGYGASYHISGYITSS